LVLSDIKPVNSVGYNHRRLIEALKHQIASIDERLNHITRALQE